jgi:hypothetical protein
LLSYGGDWYNDRRAAPYVDRILRREKPGDLPVQFPNKFEMVVNLKTAKTLNLTIPPNLLAVADELIECNGGSSSRGSVRRRGRSGRGRNSRRSRPSAGSTCSLGTAA